MLRTRAVLNAGVLAVSLAGCGSCWTREESGPEVKGPVHAEFIVRRQGFIESGRSAPYVRGIIRIDGKIKHEHIADCHEPDRQLAGDDEGRRFAYRCAASDDWRVLHLSPQGGLYAMCRTRAAAAGSIDWSAVAKFEDAAAELVSCAGGATDALLEELLAADAAFASRVLGATRDEELLPDRETGDDAWQRAYAKLPEGERRALSSALVAGMSDAGAKGPGVWRAIVLGGIDRIGRAELFDRVDALARSSKLSISDDLALAAGLHSMVRTDAKRAGEAACRALEAEHHESLRGGYARAHFALVAARSKESCPRLIAQLGCGEEYLCGGADARHVCRADELEKMVDDALAGDAIIVAKKGPAIGYASSALALAYATSSVPEGFLRRNDRLAYRQDPAEPVCWRAGKLGIECRCIDEGAASEPILCRATGSDKTVKGNAHCIMTFDDEARVLRGKHVCEASGHCNHDADCCDGVCEKSLCKAKGPAATQSAP